MKNMAFYAVLFVLCFAHLGLEKAFGQVHVKIKNELHGNDMKIKVQCQVGDQSLGTQTILKGMAVEWRVDAPHRNSPYYCNVEWNEANGYHFEAYSESRDSQRCRSACSWHVTEEGPMLQNQRTGSWEPMPFNPLPAERETKKNTEKERGRVDFEVTHPKCFCWPPKQRKNTEKERGRVDFEVTHPKCFCWPPKH